MIGVAVIGAGAIAKTHLESCRALAGRCEVRAICDLYPDKARRLAADLPVAVDIYDDWRPALDRRDVQLVSICLPPSLHAAAAVAASAAGKHVLVEKPMAASLEECDAMIAAASTAGRLLSVVSQNRFRPPMQRMKAVLASGAAGRILRTTVNSLWWRGASYYDLAWRGTWEKEGGGCTINHAVHHVDLLLWMIGMPAEATAFFANLGHANSETEDFCTAVLKYPDGSIAQLTASLVDHGEEQGIAVQAEYAGISIPWRVKASAQLENGFPKPWPEKEAELERIGSAVPPLAHEGHVGQLDDVLTAIETGRAPAIDGAAGRRTLELIVGIYGSAASGRPTAFPIASSDRLYTKDGMISRMPRFHLKTRSVENFSRTDITLGRDVGR